MRRFFYFFLSGIIILSLGIAVAANYIYDYYESPGSLAQTTNVVFKRGEGFNAIVEDMAQQGVITQPFLFKILAIALNYGHKFQAGEYSFAPAISPHAVMELIASGKVVIHKITIAEGLTVREILTLIKNESLLDGEVPEVISEGRLLPETYNFKWGDKRADIIARMQNNMRTTAEGLWKTRKSGLPFETVEQALILASIVEKETGLAQERPRIAAVFINRLRLGMKLQSDPTVVYGMEQQMGAPLGRPLTSVDLRTETPYNTYVIAALPPSPICNPGKAALEAALNPIDSNELYFVATGSGGHNFASTLEQHNANVQAYRQSLIKQ